MGSRVVAGVTGGGGEVGGGKRLWVGIGYS